MPSLVIVLLIGRALVVLHHMRAGLLHLRCRRTVWSHALPAAMTHHRGNTLDWQQDCQQPDNEKLAPGLHRSRVIRRLPYVKFRHDSYITDWRPDSNPDLGLPSSIGSWLALGQRIQATYAETIARTSRVAADFTVRRRTENTWRRAYRVLILCAM